MTHIDAAKFASMPRPGIRSTPKVGHFKLLRRKLIAKASNLKASGHPELARRAETALSEVTHELMRLGAFR